MTEEWVSKNFCTEGFIKKVSLEICEVGLKELLPENRDGKSVAHVLPLLYPVMGVLINHNVLKKKV